VPDAQSTLRLTLAARSACRSRETLHQGDFVVTGPDIEPARFKTRREAKDWCVAHYPGSPIKEIGPIYKPPPRAERRAVKRGLSRQPISSPRALGSPGGTGRAT
jgi:hypothetical protein